MTQQIATTDGADRVLEVLVSGNLSVLTPTERLDYYNRVCESLSLNPLTKPFEFLTLSNKLVLYATKAASDQLRQIKGVSITIEDQRQVGDLYMVTVTATDATGRRDSDMGVVSVKNLAGENLANAMLKAVTKAKRRCTLSICGLGMLDETEVEDIPASAKRPPVVMPQPRIAAPETEDGEPSAPRRAANAPANEPPISKFWRDCRASGIAREQVVALLGHEEFERLDADELGELLIQLREKHSQAAFA